jgi:hypothetical protein
MEFFNKTDSRGDMRKVEVTVNSQLTFVIDVESLPTFISFLTGKSVKSGYGASAEIVPVEFSLNYQNIVSEEPKTAREKALEEERDMRDRWWSEESDKVRKLEAELKALKEKDND